MKNIKSKVISAAMASLMAVSAMSAAAVTVSADWNKTDTGYTYTDSNGNKKNGWQTIDGSKYFLGTNGIRRTGFKTIASSTYYFGSDGKMRTGFQKIKGSTYYFGTDGKMRTGKVKIDGKTYRFDNNGKLKGEASANLTASEVLSKLKKELGSSYTCDNVCTQSELESFFELDMSKIESGVYENNEISAVYMDTAVILKVRDGYAKTAAAKLQERYNQIASYSFLGSYDNYKSAQARLFVNGNYVALIILGKNADSEEAASSEAEKIDAAWEKILGSKGENIITVPEVGELEDGLVL